MFNVNTNYYLYKLDKYILEIDSVELSFGGRQILNSVYLSIESGKISGLLGRNGSGKSSLMKILCGEVQATFKTMRIDSVWHKQFSASQLMYLPQKSYIPKNLLIKQVFKDFKICGLDFTDIFPEFSVLMDKKVGQLSGGERRIVEIYSVLKADTQFVMLDEPFSQIMPLHVSKIKSLISNARESKGILITDHLYQHIIDLSDSLYVVDNETIYLTREMSDLAKHGYIHSQI